jgi:hypothetical protein
VSEAKRPIARYVCEAMGKVWLMRKKRVGQNRAVEVRLFARIVQSGVVITPEGKTPKFDADNYLAFF